MSIRILLAAAVCSLFLPSARAGTNHLEHTGAHAPGVTSVTKVGTVYKLRFVGDETIEYQIDVADPFTAGGILRVYEATSQSYPLYKGGAVFRRADDTTWMPEWMKQFCVLTGQSTTANSVILDYQVNLDGVHRQRHTFTIVGKTLRVHVEDRDQSTTYKPNYCGLYVGPTANTADPRIIQMQGALSTPLVLFERGAQHYFFSNMLDIPASHASSWGMPLAKNAVKTASTIDFSANTNSLYSQLGPVPPGTNRLADYFDDTVSIIVSQKIQDVLVTPTQPASPYRELLEDRTVVLLSGPYGWSNFSSLFNNFTAWGMDNLAGYVFFNWTSRPADPPLISNGGPDWYPAVDPNNFKNMVSSGLSKGFLFGAYTTFNIMPPQPNGPPNGIYDVSHIARSSSGAMKLMTQTGLPLMAEGAINVHASREANLLKAQYGANMGYLDVSSYASPSKGADGDHVDQLGTSPWAKNLQQACTARMAWMQGMQEIYKGPLLGEGSIATQGSNLEFLWPGACDSVQRAINTGAGKIANAIPAGDPLAITVWPVIPEFEYRVMAPKQANHGNGFGDRFFGPSDGPTMFNAGTLQPIYPFTEPALDRYRLYELTYGHTSYFQTNGPMNGTGNVIYVADMVKEYYLCNALQSHYLGSPVDEILYMNGGTLQTFEQILFQSETTDSFRDPQIRMRFQDGLTMYLNHSTSNWSIVIGASTFVIPQDGFFAYVPPLTPSSFQVFSAIPPTTGGKRIDYCHAPGQWEMFDGRGQVGGYGNLTAPAKYLAVKNFAYGITLQEQGLNGAIQVTTGTPPTLVSVEIQPAALALSPLQRVGVKGIARYSNGSFRTVTTLLSLNSSNGMFARVNSGGAVTALRPGVVAIGAADFQGVPVTPAILTVQ
jgi:hypothetical protein